MEATEIAEPLSPEASLLRELRLEVAREAEEARRQAGRDWAKPLEQRLAEGIAIEKAWCDHQGEGWIQVHCPDHRSRFRAGDMARVGFGNPLAERAVTAFIEEDLPDGFLLHAGAREQSEYAAELQALPGERVIDLGIMDLSEVVLGGLQQVSETARGQRRILPLLLGTRSPVFDETAFQEGLLHGERGGLNWNQSEALAQAMSSDLCALVQGPPGTGKTRVLAELAGLLVRAGKRVMVTSFTHRAINNALDAIGKRWGGSVPVAKFAGSAPEHKSVSVFGSWKLCPWKRFNDGFVAGVTPYAASGAIMEGAEFDVVLMDEASQVTLPLACLALLKADRWVLFGDHRQLPPVMRTRSGVELPRSSIFGRLAGRGFDTMLTETWRLGPVLSGWPSRQFYGGALEPRTEEGHERLDLVRPPRRFTEVLDPQSPRVFLSMAHEGARRRNEAEAGVVADLVAEMLHCGVPAGEIAVISPFRAQAGAIRQAFKERSGRKLPREIVVDTVERMQGQERDAIVVSLTTSDSRYAERMAEFYFQPERLNVSITRARRKLVLVGSTEVLRAFPSDPRLRQAVDLLRSLLRESKVVRHRPEDPEPRD
ncbi:MAG: AAA family ATPase [Fibrobacteria bacterium]|nr:AAA family ATPase [Fibrobacteria bacterium]